MTCEYCKGTGTVRAYRGEPSQGTEMIRCQECQPTRRATLERRERLSKAVYDAVFEILDAEPEFDGMAAGRIATSTQQWFLASLKDWELR